MRSPRRRRCASSLWKFMISVCDSAAAAEARSAHAYRKRARGLSEALNVIFGPTSPRNKDGDMMMMVAVFVCASGARVQ